MRVLIAPMFQKRGENAKEWKTKTLLIHTSIKCLKIYIFDTKLNFQFNLGELTSEQ